MVADVAATALARKGDGPLSLTASFASFSLAAVGTGSLKLPSSVPGVAIVLQPPGVDWPSRVGDALPPPPPNIRPAIAAKKPCLDGEGRSSLVCLRCRPDRAVIRGGFMGVLEESLADEGKGLLLLAIASFFVRNGLV